MYGRTLCLLAAVASVAYPQAPDRPVRHVTDPGVVTTRQVTTPAGVSSIFDGRLYGVTFGASSDEVWVLHARAAYRMDWRRNSVLATVPTGRGPGMQALAWDARNARALAVTADPDGKLPAKLFSLAAAKPELIAEATGATYMAGALAVRNVAVAAMTHANKLAVFDLEKGTLRGTVTVGMVPFGVALDSAGTVAWVSNWGGRVSSKGDRTAPTGLRPNADLIVVNEAGIASTGTVSRVDLAAMRVTHTLPSGLHPSALAWDDKNARLYVANGNSDSITVIETSANRVVATWPIKPFSQTVAGIAPTALALGPGGRDLYVACGGINAVAVIQAATGTLRGLIPTAWYPNALALSPDGKWLAVTNLLGSGSGWRDEKQKRFVHANRGSLQVLPMPDDAQLASYTSAVGENNHLRLWMESAPATPRRTAAPPAMPVPERAGDASLIEHVVFIIKENRTYDQVFGDLPQGNGDPSLVMFGREITPNQHRLAEQFVLLDNFYATGGNSADGHQWITQANEVDYCLWPGFVGRSYPYDGIDPLAYSKNGFLWDAALKAGRSVRVFGEYAGTRRTAMAERLPQLRRWQAGEDFQKAFNTVAPIEPLNRILAANYPAYTTAIPDVVRSQIFLGAFKEWTRAGKMPNLVLVQLPSNHTAGTTPGVSTPQAMVADNDLATGQIVEALTHSPFWKKMAIFIVEDDAQNGVDHVDGHRTVALAVSPYTRRGFVDSTFYAHQSMLKTIELMLGMPSLSIFDLIATDMRASFTTTPDFTPYDLVKPEPDLFAVNPPAAALKGEARHAAQQSARMNWHEPDAAPSARLNRILWHTVRGWSSAYPGVRRSVLSPLAVETEDEDR